MAEIDDVVSPEPEVMTRLKTRLEQFGMFWTVCKPIQDGWTLKLADATTVNLYISTGKITVSGLSYTAVEQALGIRR
jgi:hypothetical protein